MNFKDLRGVICVDPDTKGGDKKIVYLATSPVTLQPGTMPYRLVLVVWGDQLVVWNEYFKKHYLDPDGNLHVSKPYHETGSYLRIQDLRLALEVFAERLEKLAKFVPSILPVAA